MKAMWDIRISFSLLWCTTLKKKVVIFVKKTLRFHKICKLCMATTHCKLLENLSYFLCSETKFKLLSDLGHSTLFAGLQVTP